MFFELYFAVHPSSTGSTVDSNFPQQVVAFIPARFASTRFPGKPLADIDGRPMIEHVYRRASAASSVAEVIVATDDLRIATRVNEFGGRVRLTKATHRSAPRLLPNGFARVSHPSLRSLRRRNDSRAAQGHRIHGGTHQPQGNQTPRLGSPDVSIHIEQLLDDRRVSGRQRRRIHQPFLRAESAGVDLQRTHLVYLLRSG